MDPRRVEQKKAGATVVRANVIGQPIGERIVLDRRRRRLSAVVKRHAYRNRAYIVSVHRPGEILRPEDHTLVAREDWAKTLVKHDSIILITHLPLGRGSNSSGKQIGAALSLLALSLAAPYAVSALGAAVPGLGLVTAAGALTPVGTAISLGLAAGEGRIFK